MILSPVKISLRELADQASRDAAAHPVMSDLQRTSIEIKPGAHKEAYERDVEARMVFARSVLKAAGVALESDKQRSVFEQHSGQSIYPESNFELWLAGWKAAATARRQPKELRPGGKKKTGPARGRPGTLVHCMLGVLRDNGPLLRKEIFNAMKAAGADIANMDALSVLLNRSRRAGEVKHQPDARWTLAASLPEGWVRYTGSSMPDGITAATLLHVELANGHMRYFIRAGDLAWGQQTDPCVTWYCLLKWCEHTGTGLPHGLHADKLVAVRLRKGSVLTGSALLFNWEHAGDQATEVIEYAT